VSTIHFCLLCHTEGSGEDFEVGLPAMLELRDRVEGRTGRRLNLTWALGTYHFRDPERCRPSVFEEYGETFKQLLRRGDEIGLHPHGVPDENNVMRVDRFISADTAALRAAGFPQPSTFVGGTWSFYPSTLMAIEREGYRVDSTVAGGRQEQGGVIIYDYPPTELLHPVWRGPYRMAKDNVVKAGDSGIIEVPASGHAIEFERGRDEELVWPFFEHHITERFKMRWERRDERQVDVFEVFWHPFEAVVKSPSIRPNLPMLGRLEEFLGDIGRWDGVLFSTVSEAAADWSRRAERCGSASS
jgi:hypothetical protein